MTLREKVIDWVPAHTNRELVVPICIGLFSTTVFVFSLALFLASIYDAVAATPVPEQTRRAAVPPAFARYMQGRLAHEAGRSTRLQREIDSLSVGVAAARAEMKHFERESASREIEAHGIRSHIDAGISERWYLEDRRDLLSQDIVRAKKTSDQIEARLHDLKLETFRKYLKEKR